MHRFHIGQFQYLFLKFVNRNIFRCRLQEYYSSIPHIPDYVKKDPYTYNYRENRIKYGNIKENHYNSCYKDGDPSKYVLHYMKKNSSFA